MKYIISRYYHDVDWVKDYTEDYVMYDRTKPPIDDPRVIPTDNIGSDIYDKLTYIIDNYDNLPDVAVYTKANIFKYVSKKEFDKIKDNKTFTPILTQNHKVYEPICRYKDGIYEEINNRWYLGSHPAKYDVDKLMLALGIWDKKYVSFAPGSNYILPRNNILQRPKEFYEDLKGYLDWAVYPGEAQIIERGLLNIWR